MQYILFSKGMAVIFKRVLPGENAAKSEDVPNLHPGSLVKPVDQTWIISE